MSCLDHLLHALARTGRPVLIRVSTLRARAGGELLALRPDLDLRGQVKAWAEQHGLVAAWDAGACWVTFHPAEREGGQGEEETRSGGDNQP